MEVSVVEACEALFGPGGVSKEAFLRSLNLPDARWYTRDATQPLAGWLELEDRPSVEVRFADWDSCGLDGMPGGRKLRVGVVVLAAEELEYRCQQVPPELAAAASLALVTGAIHVYKTRLP